MTAYGSIGGRLNFASPFGLKDSQLDFLFPLYDKGAQLFFSQSSLSKNNERWQFNFGLGARYFMEKAALGANAFLDYDARGHNARLSMGAEYGIDYFHLALNSYFPLTSWHESAFILANNVYSERPALGFDLRLKAFLPSYPQLGANAVMEQYFGRQVAIASAKNLAADPFAVKLALSYSPVPLANIELGIKKSPQQISTLLGANIIYHLGVALEQQLDSSNIDFFRRVAGSRYDFIERNNNIILQYRKYDPIKLKSVSGFEGELLSLVSHADLSDSWQIKLWDNPASLVLTPECFDKKSILNCKVKLPAYKDSAAPSDNIYDLRLVLLYKASAVEHSYYAKVTVNDIVNYNERDKFDLAFQDEKELIARPKAALNLFARSTVGSNWHIKAWQIKKAGESAWSDAPQDSLSSACFHSEQLKECQALIGDSDSSMIRSYGLRVELINEAAGQSRSLETNITIDPQSLSFIQNNPIVAREATEIGLFKELTLTNFRHDISWSIPENFKEKGGLISPACLEIKELAKCSITLPHYWIIDCQQTHANNYVLSLSVRRDGKETQQISWQVRVLPRYDKVRVTFQSDKTKLNYSEAATITIFLEAGNKPLDISEEDFWRYVQLALNDKPGRGSLHNRPLQAACRDKDFRPSPVVYLSNVRYIEPAGYSVELIARQQDAELELGLYYADDKPQIINITISGEEARGPILRTERDVVLLESMQGLPSKVRYGAYDKYGTALPLDELVLKFETRHGADASEAVRFKPITKAGTNSSERQVELYAQKKDQYFLSLYRKEKRPKEGLKLLAQRDIYFTDGMPFISSAPVFSNKSITLDESGGFPAQTKLIFEAYDEYGHKLNYDQLSAYKHIAQKISLQILDPDCTALPLYKASLHYEGGNIFSWQETGLGFVRDNFNTGKLGTYYARILFDGRDIGAEAQLAISAEQMVPDEIEVSPSQQTLFLSKPIDSYVDFEFKKYGFAIAAAKAPISFKIFKDGLLSDIRPEVTQVSYPMEQNILNRVAFKITERGEYKIVAYYRKYDIEQTEIPIDNASAHIAVYAEPGSQQSELTISPEQLAPDSRAGAPTIANVDFKAKDSSGRPISLKAREGQFRLVAFAKQKDGSRSRIVKDFGPASLIEDQSCNRLNCLRWQIKAQDLYRKSAPTERYSFRVLHNDKEASEMRDLIISLQYTLPTSGRALPSHVKIFDIDYYSRAKLHFEFKWGEYPYGDGLNQRIIYQYKFFKDPEAEEIPYKSEADSSRPSRVFISLWGAGVYEVQAYYKTFEKYWTLVPIEGAKAVIYASRRSRDPDITHKKRLPEKLAIGSCYESEMLIKDPLDNKIIRPADVRLIIRDEEGKIVTEPTVHYGCEPGDYTTMDASTLCSIRPYRTGKMYFLWYYKPEPVNEYPIDGWVVFHEEEHEFIK